MITKICHLLRNNSNRIMMQDSCNLQLTSNNKQNDELRGYLFANKNSLKLLDILLR